MEIPEHRAPGCLRLSLPALHREHDLLAIREGTDHDQERGLGVFEPGFHIQAIRPHVYDLQVIQPTPFPGLILELPATFKPGQRCSG
jgi:hypothetical protein